MRKWPFFFSCALLILASVGSSPTELQDAAPPPGLKPVVEGNCAFAMDLYAHLKDAPGNLFLSPYSISSALAIAYGGARGNTEKQMRATLHFPADQDSFHSAMSELRQRFATFDQHGLIKLNVANGLWTQSGFHFNPAFLTLAKDKYGAVVNPVDFTSNPDSIRPQINQWVDDQTRHKINNAIAPGTLSDQTRLVILNAIYFKGDWASRFDATGTEQEPFWITPSKSVQASMMRQNHVFLYAEQDGLQILKLPYIGDDLSMLVLLPKQRDGLPELEKRLNAGNLARWISALGAWTVEVRFPKFKTESRFSLKQPLFDMGMTDAFSDIRADFSAMAPERPLSIDAVEHAALVEVDENGTVAAAATHAFSISCAKEAVPPPATFHADHPFVFLIRDNHTGTILFLGRIVDPAK
jgi:serpin B